MHHLTRRQRRVGSRRWVQGMVAVVTWCASLSVGFAQSGNDPHRLPGLGGGPPEGAVSIQALAAVGDKTVYAGSFGAGTFVSDDRGARWKAANEGLSDPFVLSMAVGQDGTVYAGTFRGGVFRRKPAATGWEPLSDGLKRLEVKALLTSQGMVYAGTGDGVYQLKESATKWTSVTSGLDDTLVHAVGRATDGTLFAGTSGKGVMRYRKHTSGKEAPGKESLGKDALGWTRLRQGLKDHEGLIENFIRVITLDDRQNIYIGTFDGGVFVSADRGDTWRPISRALPNDSIRGILSAEQRLIVATGRGIFRTDNQGQLWVPLNKGLTEMSVQALVASRIGTLYAGTSGGVFRSEDEGKSWVQMNEGLLVKSEVPFTFQ